MTMDEFFDTVTAQMQSEQAELEKSGSKKTGGLITQACSAPPLAAFRLEVAKHGRVKTSFTEPPLSQSESSGRQASTREPGNIKRPMTKAQVLAWKARNSVFPIPPESEEGVDTSARRPPPPAERPEMVAPGDPSSAPAECNFWSLEPNIGSLFGTTSD
jgi:hypothetical protein